MLPPEGNIRNGDNITLDCQTVDYKRRIYGEIRGYGWLKNGFRIDEMEGNGRYVYHTSQSNLKIMVRGGWILTILQLKPVYVKK